GGRWQHPRDLPPRASNRAVAGRELNATDLPESEIEASSGGCLSGQAIIPTTTSPPTPMTPSLHTAALKLPEIIDRATKLSCHFCRLLCITEKTEMQLEFAVRTEIHTLRKRT